MEQLVLTTLKDAGPTLVLIGFFIWRDFKREDVLNKRIDASEKYLRNLTTTLLERAVVAIETSNDVLGLLRERPCIARKAGESKS